MRVTQKHLDRFAAVSFVGGYGFWVLTLVAIWCGA